MGTFRTRDGLPLFQLNDIEQIVDDCDGQGSLLAIELDVLFQYIDHKGHKSIPDGFVLETESRHDITDENEFIRVELNV